jgi:integral membrane protein (TIGR01906 family)
MLFRSLLSNIFKLLFVVSLPLVLVLTNLYFFVSPSFVESQYARLGVPRVDHLSEEETFNAMRTVLDYLRDRQSVEALENLKRGQQALFNQREISHLVDVRNLMSRFFAVQKLASLIMGVSILVILAEKRARKRLAHYLLWSSGATLVVIGLLLLLAYLAFDWVFTQFHLIFFEAGTWLFNPSDPIIQLFFPTFWMNTARKFILAIVVQAALVCFFSLAFIGFRARRKSKTVSPTIPRV